MSAKPKQILVINPGSTSTKFAIYADDKPMLVENLRHTDAEMAVFKGKSILDQHEFRRAFIVEAMSKAGVQLTDLSAVVGRGGLLKPIPSGTYRVNRAMLDDLRVAARGEHASNLGAYLAFEIAQKTNIPAFIVDPVCVDEWPARARLSGCLALPRHCLSHALNTKAIARRFAREQGRKYEELKLVVAHLGSGISVSAHEHGRMVDVTNRREEGPFSAESAGTVPVMSLVYLCFSGKYTRDEVETMLYREGGLSSYLGTKDLVRVEEKVKAGDENASLVFDAMVYQIAKEIGAMSAALQGGIDAVLLTGGMAYSKEVVRKLSESVGWIAPVHVFAGEDELQALAEGALRVLRGEEVALEYGPPSAVASAT
jgi:butyrate kinase